MNVEMPLTREWVKNEFDGDMVLCTHVMPGSLFVRRETINMGAEPDRWRVEDGVLSIMDGEGRHVAYEFGGVEGVNGSVVLTGATNLQASSFGHMRAVAYREHLLADADFGVAISSHVAYEDITLPRLLASLRANGVPDEKIVLVVAGDHSVDAPVSLTDSAITHVRVKDELLGFAALPYLRDTHAYWLLLHDTCELTSDFEDRVAEVDVGMNYDFISVADDGLQCEIGFWRSRFLTGLPDSVWQMKAIDLHRHLMAHTKARCSLPVSTQKTGKIRDVYGTGVQRKVLTYDGLGIKKYVGASMMGGRP